MNLIRGKLYFIRVFILLIFVYISISIEYVDLVRVKTDSKNFLEAEEAAKDAEKSLLREPMDEEEENPWLDSMAIYATQQANEIKPIKGAVFGVWSRKTCYRVHHVELKIESNSLKYCAERKLSNFYTSYSDGFGCELLNVKPDCLIKDSKAYSFAAHSTVSYPDYELPPCIDASKGWQIKATCNNKPKETYTCENNKWIGTDQSEVSSCALTETWDEIQKSFFLIDVKQLEKIASPLDEDEMIQENNYGRLDTDMELTTETNPWEKVMGIYDSLEKSFLKPIKGAVFGKWEKNRCIQLSSVQSNRLSYSFTYCANRKSSDLFTFYSKRDGCVFFRTKPDCLVKDETAYSFFAFSEVKLQDYSLPPCFIETINWKVEATCNDKQQQFYTCNAEKWIGDDNTEITTCTLNDKIENIEAYYEADEEEEEEFDETTDKSEELETEKRPVHKITEEMLTYKENPWEEYMNIYDVSMNNQAVKPIKGALFGKWEINKCKPLKNTQLTRDLLNLETCVSLMFTKDKSVFSKSNDKWATFTKDTWCRIHDEMSNCFIYDDSAYSFTLGSMTNLQYYDLPPCIDASENWKIEATCRNHSNQNYTCKNGRWVGDDDTEISICNLSEDEKKQQQLEEVLINEPITEKNTELTDETETEETVEEEKLNPWETVMQKYSVSNNRETAVNEEESKPMPETEITEEEMIEETEKHDNENGKPRTEKQDNERNVEKKTASSCNRIGISFGMLVAVVAIFV